MSELLEVVCKICKGTGIKPEQGQKDNRCLWCQGKGKHFNVPYPMFCLHPEKCAGYSCCPRNYSCCD